MSFTLCLKPVYKEYYEHVQLILLYSLKCEYSLQSMLKNKNPLWPSATLKPQNPLNTERA